MSSKFYLYAPQVHTGGGKTLLEGLINNPPKDLICNLIIDTRLDVSNLVLTNWNVKVIKSSFVNRLIFEKWLSMKVKKNDKLLFYSNLPPLFKMPGFISLFIQNRYLIDKKDFQGFSFVTKIKIRIQKFLLKRNLRLVSQVVVQTETMARIFRDRICKSTELKIYPILDIELINTHDGHPSKQGKSLEFIYVASGEPHKNHIKLLKAWELLSQDLITPVLHLTVDTAAWPKIGLFLKRLSSNNKIHIINHGNIPHKKIFELYEQVDALIYPSLFESFGIPLLEARKFNLPILCSELDYARDLINPKEAFDPNSAISIQRSVKRFLGQKDKLQTIRSSKEFLAEITKN